MWQQDGVVVGGLGFCMKGPEAIELRNHGPRLYQLYLPCPLCIHPQTGR